MKIDLKEQNFITMLEKLIPGQSVFQMEELRRKFWDAFLSLGLPKASDEGFQQIRLRDLYLRNYEPIKVSEKSSLALTSLVENELRIVFVNGKFCEKLSSTNLPAGLSILPLSSAIHSFSAFLNSRFQRSFKEEKNPFVFLNGALSEEGVFIYVQPKTVLSTPLYIYHIVNDEDGQLVAMHPRLHLFIGREAKLSCIFEQKTSLGPFENICWVNFLLDCIIEENAHFVWNHLNLADKPLLWNFENFRITLRKNAFLKTVSIANGNRTARQDYRICLSQDNSQAYLYGLWNQESARQTHVCALLEHMAPSAQSLQHFKGILSDFSRSSFEGKIFVDPQAQKTQAYQRNNNLILSDEASAHSKPNLEIFADDVKASHGATIGQLSQDEIFYLQSRGISTKEAKKILVQGFAKEIIDQIDPSLQSRVLEYFSANQI